MKSKRQEALDKIEELKKYIETLPAEPVKSKEELMEETFLELINQGLTVKHTEGRITYYNGDEWVVDQDLKNKQVLFRYSSFWSVFGTKCGCNWQETRDSLNGMVETHLNCKGFTATISG